MATVLHLGVFDVPYTGVKEHVTTGQVADWLERRYHVMEVFWAVHGQEAADKITEGYAGALESLMMGAPIGSLEDVLNQGAGDVAKLFKKFLESGEIEGLGIPGVPTDAAKKRRSLRFKSKKSKRVRPSFIDTGLYDDNFHAWVEYDPMGFRAFGYAMADALGDY